MSVLIKGMEIPKSCDECVFYRKTDPVYDYCCISSATPKGCVPNDCPLVEIPTPHGTLVDSDHLSDIALQLMHTAKNDDIANGVKWLWQYIIEATTVIESEDGDP